MPELRTMRSAFFVRKGRSRLRRLRGSRSRWSRLKPPWWYTILLWATRNQQRTISVAPVCFAGSVLLLLLLAWVRPIDHDESQYIAAVALTPRLLPYRDFAFLQTPLQPLLFGPFAPLFTGHLWEALRLANALLGAGVLWLVFCAQRELGVTERKALIATALLMVCDSFLFGAGTARNDMLPALLATAATYLIVRGFRHAGGASVSFFVGLLGAAATAAKISYAFPLAAMLLIAVLDQKMRLHPLRWGWLGWGAALAAVPVLALFWLAPQAFLFGVLRFPAAAPALWYEMIGQGWKLGWSAKGLDFAKFMALGPSLVALLMLGRNVLRRDNPLPCLYIDMLVMAGLIAAILPTPVWRQYLIPMLPPLFIRLGVILDQRQPERWTRLALIVTAIAGTTPSALAITEALWSGQAPLALATAQAHEIGSLARTVGATGSVAGLSPHYWIDSGLPLDPRFAAGPFIFRTQGLLTRGEERALGLVSLDNVSAALGRDPPAIVITGGERNKGGASGSLDGALDRYALANGYGRLPLSHGGFTIYVRGTCQTTGQALPRHGCTRRGSS